MKQTYFFLLLFISLFSNAQIINFPDANFKALLLSASATETSNQIANNFSGEYVKIDANNDGEIQISEAHQIKYLRKYCNSCSESQKIASIEGIQNFINLTDLQLTYQHISNINLLNDLINLQTINFASNWIENIYLPNLTNLTSLSLRNNYIANISLSNYKNLTSINLENNLLTFLNLNNLKYLNQILIANNPNLTHLFFVNYVTNYSFPVSFGSNSNVRYLCVDEFDTAAATSTFNISNSGTPIVINQYCETFYEGLGLNVLKGNVVLDQNNNGCDTNDTNFKNLKLIVGDVSNHEISYSNESGYYDIFLQEGNFTITPQLENQTYFTITPTNVLVDFPTQTSPLTQNFCITPNGIKHDVEVSIIPINPARPGFNAAYKIIYKNKGNQIENGTIAFSYLNQDALDVISVTPTYTSEFNDTFERTFYWQYTNLLPFESREITFVLNLNTPLESPALNSGDMLNMNASITPFINDEYINDNEMPLRQIIVNSYDPNDKKCLQGNTIAPSEVGEYVHYVIRFENTGTFPAENIVVKDIIDTTKFDISSLVPLYASHDYATKINGNKVEFIFENINLPFDNATNDGYIAFKIKTLPSLVVGNTFSNLANIYFDYNFPIITNTATTTIAALNNPSFEFANYFSLYPNPTTNELNINLKSAIEINSIQIYNTIGQLVTIQTGNALKVDVSNLKTGNYFIKINTSEGYSTSQFIKE